MKDKIRGLVKKVEYLSSFNLNMITPVYSLNKNFI